MARMMGFALADSYSRSRRNAHASAQLNGVSRRRERRVTQKWLDEYEDRPQAEWQACPKGGLACTCNKLPDECPHMDDEYWDNEYRRGYAIGEQFDIKPTWTMATLRVNRYTL